MSLRRKHLHYTKFFLTVESCLLFERYHGGNYVVLQLLTHETGVVSSEDRVRFLCSHHSNVIAFYFRHQTSKNVVVYLV